MDFTHHQTSWLLTFLAVLLSSNHSKATICPNVSTSTRYFTSLTDYQGNKVAFSQNENAVSFRLSSLILNGAHSLEKNAFITLGSQKIAKLDLAHKMIQQIDAGAFITLDCLQILDLSFNEIMEITDLGTFQGLPSLRELDLSYNLIRKLHSALFKVHPLNALRSLNLEGNHLADVPKGFLGPMVNLISFNIAHNNIYDVKTEQWINESRSYNLENLDLSRNRLKGFDTIYLHFPQLQHLNLSSNRLTRLNLRALRRVAPQLKTLDINDNQWTCDYVKNIIKPWLYGSAIQYSSNPEDEFAGLSCGTNKSTSSTSSSTQRNNLTTVDAKDDKPTFSDDSDVPVFVKVIVWLIAAVGVSFVVYKVAVATRCMDFVYSNLNLARLRRGYHPSNDSSSNQAFSLL